MISFLTRIRWRLQRNRREKELREELEFHLAEEAGERQADGLTEKQARWAARRDLGNVTLLREDTHTLWRWTPFEQLAQDLRYALRVLWGNAGFAAVAIFSIALGIAVNSAIFSLVNAVLLRPLPVTEPQRLRLFSMVGSTGTPDDFFSYPLYQQFRETRGFEDIAASGDYAVIGMVVNGGGGAAEIERVEAERVSTNFFTVLGVRATVGRVFTADDDSRQPPEMVMVISDAFWRRRFAADPNVVGRSVTLSGVPATIVGVAPPGFFGFVVDRPADLWMPIALFANVAPAFLPGIGFNLGGAESSWLRLIGRLRPETTSAQAEAEADAILQGQLQQRAEVRGARLGPAWTSQERASFLNRRLALQDGRTGANPLRKDFSRPLLMLTIAVGLVLLVACSNVANLLLARAAARQREISVRLAIGASRWRLVRQLLTESLLLAGLGGLAGLIGARWIAAFFVTMLPEGGLGLDVTSDWRVLVFTGLATIATGFIFGLIPALRSTRLDAAAGLKTAPGGAHIGSRLTLNKALVVSQVALSVFLLVGAGLFVRTLQNLRGLDVGFARKDVTLIQLDNGTSTLPQRVDFYERLLDRLRALPGVDGVSMFRYGLLRGDNWSQKVTIPGYTPAVDEDTTSFGQIVGPRFFETMRIPLVGGRDFGDAEMVPVDRGGHATAVINEAMARRFFGESNPVGRTLILQNKAPLEIVGVAKDIKYRSLREETVPTFYVSAFQYPGFGGMTVVVRAAAGRISAETLGRAVREIDPQTQVMSVRTMQAVVDETMTTERFVARLAGSFGLFALMLASIGLFGVMSYIVARRTKEFAVRVALGARRGQVVGMAVRDTLALTAVGFAIGLPAAFGAARFVKTLLYGVGALDLATAAATALVMLVVSALAAYVPARRAARVDPMVALRHE